MKNKKPNAELVWKQLEDHLVPQLRFSTTDRAVYSHLVRHSRLEGKRQLRFSMAWLAHGTRLCEGAARPAVGRLIDQGALRLVERSKTGGHVVEVLLPGEIPSARPDPTHSGQSARQRPPVDIEEMDFVNTKALRQAIHERERGLCFYCLRKINSHVHSLDHVVPQAQFGRNSYRNIVSCCLECNSQKGDRRVPDFLRWLYREGRLTAKELSGRLRALEDLAVCYNHRKESGLPCGDGSSNPDTRPRNSACAT